jgi:hypothetical protein
VIRFTRQPRLGEEDRFLVTARRVPRGYIRRIKTTQEVRVSSRNFASVDWRTVEGWQPVGLQGQARDGECHSTRRAAAHVLVSDHMFDSKIQT